MTASLPEIAGDPAGFGRALDLFRRAAAGVPAYRAFLAEAGIDPDAIRTAADFRTVPAVTKNNYLKRHPRPDLLWGGDIAGAGSWWASSGSTGAQTYWPGGGVTLEEGIEFYDRMFRHSFASHLRPTLLVVGFAMGNWIGGIYTYRIALELRRRGHQLSVCTPGAEVDTILANIADLGPDYAQVVVAGYPPLLHDVLDRANDAVLHQDLRFLAAGESISEESRDHLLRRIGKPGEPDRICLIYGTADAGVMGHETATTIALRRLARTDSRFAITLFGGGAVLPTFVEFDPQLRYTEVDERGRFLFTIDGALPLLRYRINDEGRIFTAAQIEAALRDCGHRMPVRTSTLGAGFLALYGRADVAASFYAVKIYPESIQAALHEPELYTAVTGRFVVTTELDATFAQTLVLHVEMRENVLATPAFTELVRERVIAALTRTSTEYRRLRTELGTAADPVLTLDPFGSTAFRFTTKHHYVRSDR
ncbi:phenylacetate--CoA ligase family protein [Nocardia sp. SYP-A9097]|uniref:phenylacetate--CoA ligase family protein n=1 Tax=Nocardia sp. SYP-A9097 TaxID=2663237 RepID=UPI00129C0427|nr:phenylacetate--CoA ligase family protein [Nocardia sp. SYP-A9097]MRH91686.1 phenylacetate--CoA ligase family protein [Nocardia sp. SYP-A9097]